MLHELQHRLTTDQPPDQPPGSPPDHAATPAQARRRRPGAEVDRWVRVRDRHCVAPGCRRPAYASDLDHTLDHALGGPSLSWNCGVWCRHHHRTKHEGGWRVTQPSPGRFHITTRAGARHVVEPPRITDPLPAPHPGDGPRPLPTHEALDPTDHEDDEDDEDDHPDDLAAVAPARRGRLDSRHRTPPRAGPHRPTPTLLRWGRTATAPASEHSDAVRGRRRVWTWARRVGLTLLVLVVLVFAVSGAYLGWDRLSPEQLDVAPPGFDVDAAGVRTHVEHWPAVRPSGKAPLVLVPGFAESTYVWSRVAPLLAADRDVYAYDVRGYGFTDRVPPYDLASDTDQLVGLIAALGLERPIVVGHSSGVAIALSLALRAPESVTGVVAANGDGTPYFGADRTSSGGGARWVLVDPIAPALVTAAMRHRAPIRSIVAAQCGPGCPVDDAAIDRWRAPFLLPGAVDALTSILRQPLIGLTDAQETTIAVPTAILYASEDGSFTREQAQATAARLRTSLIAGLPGARHLALLGEPDRFAAALTPLLDGLDRR